MQAGDTNRNEMIRHLVEHSVSKALAEPQQYWMREVFEQGFVGYSKLSDQQLRMEMQLRGLEPSGDAFDEDCDDELSFDPALM